MLVKRFSEGLPGGAREPQLKRRQTESSNCRVRYGTYQIVASCYGDKGVRKQMEDEHLMLPSLLPFQPSLSLCDFAVFGVFDGHGGRQAALFVKEALPAELAAQLLLLQREKQQHYQQHYQQQQHGWSAVAVAGGGGEQQEGSGGVGGGGARSSSSRGGGGAGGMGMPTGGGGLVNGECAAREGSAFGAAPGAAAAAVAAAAEYEEEDDEHQQHHHHDANKSPFETTLSDREMKQVLFAAFKKVDARIATEIPACRDGCTAVVVLMRDRQVYVACLGDSAAYLARKKDSTLHSIPLTEVHRHWVIEEKERIARMGGTIENGRVNGALEVTRSFGDISLKRYGVSCLPTVKKFTLNPNEDQFLLLGCDGFWNCWTARDAITFAAELWDKEVRSSKVHSRPVDPQNVCKQLPRLNDRHASPGSSTTAATANTTTITTTAATANTTATAATANTTTTAATATTTTITPTAATTTITTTTAATANTTTTAATANTTTTTAAAANTTTTTAATADTTTTTTATASTTTTTAATANTTITTAAAAANTATTRTTTRATSTTTTAVSETAAAGAAAVGMPLVLPSASDVTVEKPCPCCGCRLTRFDSRQPLSGRRGPYTKEAQKRGL